MENMTKTANIMIMTQNHTSNHQDLERMNLDLKETNRDLKGTKKKGMKRKDGKTIKIQNQSSPTQRIENGEEK